MSSPVRTITAAKARRLALRAQGLDGSLQPPTGSTGVGQICDHLGYVQIDTISVVERAHHHILWSRQPAYGEEDLDRCLAVDRLVFEGWSHAASYLPMHDYHFYSGAMRAHAERTRTREWLAANRRVVTYVLDRIRAEGAQCAADFADDGDKRGPWWDWKPAKGALEMLLSSGELMISERRSFQRVYDLTERVLPSHIVTEPATPAQRARWALERGLDQHGVASLRELRVWNRHAPSLATALQDGVDEGWIHQFTIKGGDGLPHYARAESLEVAHRRRRASSAPVHILSPFDNLVIRREWLQRLFHFDYTIECYVPAPKRQYGYFCLPILQADRFLGRLDAKAERQKGSLALRRLSFENELAPAEIDAALPALATALHAFAAFNRCRRVRVDGVRPSRWTSPLRQALKATMP